MPLLPLPTSRHGSRKDEGDRVADALPETTDSRSILLGASFDDGGCSGGTIGGGVGGGGAGGGDDGCDECSGRSGRGTS